MVASICVLCEAEEKNAFTEQSVSSAAEKEKKGSTSKYLAATREQKWERLSKTTYIVLREEDRVKLPLMKRMGQILERTRV